MSVLKVVLTPLDVEGINDSNRVVVGKKELDGKHALIFDGEKSRYVTMGYNIDMGGGSTIIGMGVNKMQHGFLSGGGEYPKYDASASELLNSDCQTCYIEEEARPATAIVLEYCADSFGLTIDEPQDCSMLIGTVVNEDQPVLEVRDAYGTRFFTVFVRQIEGGNLVTKDTKIRHAPGLFSVFTFED
jgi:hypothetical protein